MKTTICDVPSYNDQAYYYTFSSGIIIALISLDGYCPITWRDNNKYRIMLIDNYISMQNGDAARYATGSVSILYIPN